MIVLPRSQHVLNKGRPETERNSLDIYGLMIKEEDLGLTVYIVTRNSAGYLRLPRLFDLYTNKRSWFEGEDVLEYEVGTPWVADMIFLGLRKWRH
jgi:hypothetical protein